MKKLLEFFNRIAGLIVFLIFLILLIEHLHHGRFWRRNFHRHFTSRSVSGDSTGILKADSLGKK